MKNATVGVTARIYETGTGMTQVELRYFDSCPNWKVADNRLNEAMRAEGIATPITYTQVDTLRDAQRLDFIGSPTILINAVDPFRPQSAQPGLACRVFTTDDGLQGSPTVRGLRSVLQHGERPE